MIEDRDKKVPTTAERKKTGQSFKENEWKQCDRNRRYDTSKQNSGNVSIRVAPNGGDWQQNLFGACGRETVSTIKNGNSNWMLFDFAFDSHFQSRANVRHRVIMRVHGRERLTVNISFIAMNETVIRTWRSVYKKKSVKCARSQQP